MPPKLGRKPIADVAATARVQVRVTPTQHLELQQIACENQTGVSGIIREAVTEYVADYDERRPFARKP